MIVLPRGAEATIPGVSPRVRNDIMTAVRTRQIDHSDGVFRPC